MKKRTQEEYINLCTLCHNNKYDYSKLKYIDKRTKVCIVCPKHGEFWQVANNHLRGQGCPLCAKEKPSKKMKTTEEFINNVKEMYEEKFDLSNVEYKGNKIKVHLKCNICGFEFDIRPNDLLSGHSCPHCAKIVSQQEVELKEFIKELLVDEEIIFNSRKIIENTELDIFIPSKNIAIEYNGLYWHCEEYKENNYHLNKLKKCLDKNIRLIQIFEDEWKYKKDIVKSRLKVILGKVDNKIYARKTIIKEIDYQITKSFLEENHIQGNCNALHKIGLYYNNELVSVMTFGNLRKNLNQSKKENAYELIRFCSKKNYIIIGAANKMFNFFIKKYNPNEIISYADRRWSNGNLYNKLGFTCYNISKPNYYYIIKDKRKNRFSFRKDILISKYNCPKNMTEHQFCYNNKWFRIYDCGCLCYKWLKYL